MNTRITKLFGIEYPVILSGMSWISIPEMVAAVSNAGGLGIMATGPLSADQTKKYIREIKKLTDKPFGANVSLMFPGAINNARVLIEENVPVVNFALGKGDWLVKEVHKYGGKVIATVVNLQHAKRAQDYGTDAVLGTGFEAAGHGGEITNLVFVPYLASKLEIPIIAAGGFCDGRGLVAALALGADAIAMGTRFLNTKESSVHINTKQLVLQKDVTDTFCSARFDGLPARMMKTEGAFRASKRGLNLIGALFNSRIIAKQLGLPYFRLLIGTLHSGLKNTIFMSYMANAFQAMQAAIEEGDNEKGYIPMGQIVGLVKDEPAIAELINRIMREAREVQMRLNNMSD
jgi:enoyl-[acyl-carrier protein] reductase II